MRCGGVDHPSDPHGDPPGSPLPKETDIINNPEAGIVNMIRYGMLALQLLPENSSAGIYHVFLFKDIHPTIYIKVIQKVMLVNYDQIIISL